MDFAQQRDGQEFAFGQHAVDVVYPEGDEFRTGSGVGEVVNAGFEGQQDGVVVGVTRAFGEDDEGRAFVQGLFHLFGYGLRTVAVARDEEGVEDVLDDEAADAAGQPVVGSCHGPGVDAPAARQGNPDEQEVAVAAVVGVIDFLLRAEVEFYPAFRFDPGEEGYGKAEQLVGQPGEAFFQYGHGVRMVFRRPRGVGGRRRRSRPCRVPPCRVSDKCRCRG